MEGNKIRKLKSKLKIPSLNFGQIKTEINWPLDYYELLQLRVVVCPEKLKSH